MTHSLSNETFPYTLAYVCNHLNVDEARVEILCQRFNIQPHLDTASETQFFSLQDVETLKKVIEAEKRGETLSQVPARSSSSPAFSAKSHYASPINRAEGATGMSRGDLSVIVDAVSNAKEGILRDLSHLLDDKLSGLDDVVVELIRSKSENDALREELRRLEQEKQSLQGELARFKPAAFGFWRKEG